MRLIYQKITFILICLLNVPLSLCAQEIAISERGDSVVLLPNGTWDYFENYVEPEIKIIGIDSNAYSIPKKSNKKINGIEQAYSVWFNADIWKRIPTADINPDADIALKMQAGDVYAMVIFEELEIATENLVELALNNAKSVANDIQLIDQKYKTVNDSKLIWMQMDGEFQGIKISYYSYYASNTKGSLQFHVYSGQKLIKKYLTEIDNLLNGLIFQEDN